ncbi:MAG TPA: trehalose-phosphatase [Xanthobacteraceae bacterium]|nr:trehalose-phosphatase [Xanthobacteraceae bacterium]
MRKGSDNSGRTMDAIDSVPNAPPPPVPDLRRWAILLDIDGSILDIAPSPRQVKVPGELRRTLVRIDELTGGAVALVSGRTISDIDLIFAPLRLAAIGVHGAEMRTSGDAEVQKRVRPLSNALKRKLAEIVEFAPGILVEDKGYSLALHYRLTPEKGPELLEAVAKICANAPTEPVEVLQGKLVVDVKPAGYNKGIAVSDLMRQAPFVGRHPIFIGDDTTDLPVFSTIPKFGGQAYSVGGIVAKVDGHFDRPATVRSWLARIATQSAA